MIYIIFVHRHTILKICFWWYVLWCMALQISLSCLSCVSLNQDWFAQQQPAAL